MPSDQVKAKGSQKRESKFERIDTDKLVDDIAGGVPVTIACAARGIHRDTFYKWLEDHPDFVRALASARQRKIREWITAGR